jgi:hypothetical protein
MKNIFALLLLTLFFTTYMAGIPIGKVDYIDAGTIDTNAGIHSEPIAIGIMR